MKARMLSVLFHPAAWFALKRTRRSGKSSPAPRAVGPARIDRRWSAGSFGCESLEGRSLLTATGVTPFAELTGQLTAANQTSQVVFQLNPGQLKSDQASTVVLGFKVAPASGSAVSPKIVSASGPNGQLTPLAIADHGETALDRSARQTHLFTRVIPLTTQSQSLTVNVAGITSKTGDYIVDAYLAGDVNGDGTVDATDLAAVQTAYGTRAGQSNYNAAADINGDGRVGCIDRTLTRINLGAHEVATAAVAATATPTPTPTPVAIPTAVATPVSLVPDATPTPIPTPTPTPTPVAVLTPVAATPPVVYSTPVAATTTAATPVVYSAPVATATTAAATPVVYSTPVAATAATPVVYSAPVTTAATPVVYTAPVATAATAATPVLYTAGMGTTAATAATPVVYTMPMGTGATAATAAPVYLTSYGGPTAVTGASIPAATGTAAMPIVVASPVAAGSTGMLPVAGTSTSLSGTPVYYVNSATAATGTTAAAPVYIYGQPVVGGVSGVTGANPSLSLFNKSTLATTSSQATPIPVYLYNPS